MAKSNQRTDTECVLFVVTKAVILATVVILAMDTIHVRFILRNMSDEITTVRHYAEKQEMSLRNLKQERLRRENYFHSDVQYLRRARRHVGDRDTLLKVLKYLSIGRNLLRTFITNHTCVCVPGEKGGKGEKGVKPRVTVLPKKIIAVRGSTFNISCNVTGKPSPAVKWRKANGTLKTSGIATSSGNILSFQNVSEQDTGFYICSAKNSVGIALDTSNLTVILPGCPGNTDALGISANSTKRIPDSAMTASTNYAFCPAYIGRLVGHAAWCARIQNRNQYLQIDLSRNKVIAGVATQGYSFSGGSYWVTAYQLEYSTNAATWHYYAVGGSRKTIVGNIDYNSVVTHMLREPFIARYIRFRPQAWKGYIMMRVELYGCETINH